MHKSKPLKWFFFLQTVHASHLKVVRTDTKCVCTVTSSCVYASASHKLPRRDSCFHKATALADAARIQPQLHLPAQSVRRTLSP